MRLSVGTGARRCGLLALAVLLGCVPPAFAQAEGRSYQGLFSGASAGTDRAPASLQVTVAEAYDQDVLGAAGSVPIALEPNRLFTQLTADLSYRVAGRNVQFASTAGANFRYYSEQDQVVGVGHHVGAGLSANLSRTTSLTLNQTVAYAPSYLYRLFASVAPPEPGQTNVASNYAVNDNPSYSYATDMSVMQKMGQRNRLSIAMGGHYTDYLGAPTAAVGGVPLRDLLSYETGATFIRDVRNGHLNVGYAFRRAQYATTSPTEHDLNIGFDYDRPLSRTRRTHLRFNVGSIMLQAQAPGAVSANLQQRYQFAADMALSRQFGRTWQATGAYRRSVGFIEGFSTPVLTNGLTTSTTGLVGQRVDLLLTGAYTAGASTSASAPGSGAFTSYTGSVRARVALTSLLAIYSEYLYYFYDFSHGSLLTLGAPPKMSRNSAHLGLTVNLPMGHR